MSLSSRREAATRVIYYNIRIYGNPGLPEHPAAFCPDMIVGHFRRDDRVSHARHGAGVVVDVDERYTVIAFDDGAVRKFVTHLVQLGRSDLPLPLKRPQASSRPRRPRSKVAAAGTKHTDT
jgi:hypothetical protein